MLPIIAGLVAIYSVLLIVYGSIYANNAIVLENFVDAATYEPCNVTYVEEVDCSSSWRGTSTTKQYYLYEAYSETCGNQTLDFNEEFVTCKKGTSHRKDEGAANCYIVDCDEFVFGSTENYIKTWRDKGIIMLVFGLLPCELPVLVGILYLIAGFCALCKHCYQKVRDWCQRQCPCKKKTEGNSTTPTDPQNTTCESNEEEAGLAFAYTEELAEIMNMGFSTDMGEIKRLLNEHNGDQQHVVQELVATQASVDQTS